MAIGDEIDDMRADRAREAPTASGAASIADDRLCMEHAAAARAAREAIDALLRVDGRDVDEIPGFVELWDRLGRLVDALCATEAEGSPGMMAKAELAVLLGAQDGDRGPRIAMSLARDILRVFRADPVPS